MLNANYILRSLEDVLDAPFAKSGPCMHEAIFSDKGFAGGFSTIDVAKALIDEGFHPMTMYFPLVVHGAMLVEPTETESKASLDQFIAALRSIAERAKAGDESLKAAPVYAPRRRLDETLAASKPVLTYKTPAAGAGRRNELSERRFYEAPAEGARAARLRRRCATASRSPRCWATGCRPAGWCSKSPAGPASMRSISPSASRARLAAERPASGRARLDRGVARRRPACRICAPPIVLDAASPDWPVERADAVLSINMVHISPWASALGLIDGAARLLPAGRAADPLRAVAQR